MTAKDKLRARVEELSEEEAAAALRLLDRPEDPLTRFLAAAPLDDEPTSPEEEQAVAEARAALARGELISADEIRSELSDG
jgi:hypothetical protein